MIIRELSISGGGVKGLAFLGTLYELERNNVLKLEKVAGSSIGGFIASCLASGYEISSLIEEIFHYDLQGIKDVDLENMISNKSLMRGDNLDLFFRTILSKRINPDISLKELYNISKIELTVATWSLNSGSVKYINYKSHPELSLIHLIRMASAIPIILPPIKYHDSLYVDAGLVDNMPIISKDCWCLASKSSKSSKSGNTSNMTFISYILKLSKMFFSEKSNHSNIIYVDVGNVSVTSFNITKDQRLSLIQSGINSAREYINNKTPSLA